VFIADYDVSIISFINDANSHNCQQYTTKGGCLIILQDAPHIANSGFIFFSMSYLSYNFLLHWVNFHSSYHELSVQWQNDQGWLQFTITHYASYILNTRMDIRCSHPNYARGQVDS